ncbi:hypothetical protein VIM7927_00002 [Vibrio mangrovi]|uniref:Uncharacterized protein n=1 Tax=Vibrio mangrovi TaxID=474394 RepID=A0A1Y6IPS8_9VIBR|nr:hypothetical protein VIM7927_00002 [Vibrio mangrovi]
MHSCYSEMNAYFPWADSIAFPYFLRIKRESEYEQAPDAYLIFILFNLSVLFQFYLNVLFKHLI